MCMCGGGCGGDVEVRWRWRKEREIGTGFGRMQRRIFVFRERVYRMERSRQDMVCMSTHLRYPIHPLVLSCHAPASRMVVRRSFGEALAAGGWRRGMCTAAAAAGWRAGSSSRWRLETSVELVCLLQRTMYMVALVFSFSSSRNGMPLLLYTASSLPRRRVVRTADGSATARGQRQPGGRAAPLHRCTARLGLTRHSGPELEAPHDQRPTTNDQRPLRTCSACSQRGSPSQTTSSRPRWTGSCFCCRNRRTAQPTCTARTARTARRAPNQPGS